MKVVRGKVSFLFFYSISIPLHQSSEHLHHILIAQRTAIMTEAEKALGSVPGLRSIFKKINAQKHNEYYMKGHLYELLVALEYRARGYDILAMNRKISAVGRIREFDIIARKNDAEKWIECKACQWAPIPNESNPKLYKQFEDQQYISSACRVRYQVQSYYPLTQAWNDWFMQRRILFLEHDLKCNAPRFIHL